MENSLTSPPPLKGLTIHSEDEVGLPKSMGLALLYDSSFLRALARAIGRPIILAPSASARNSLDLDTAICSSIAARGAVTATRMAIIQLPLSRLPPPKLPQ